MSKPLEHIRPGDSVTVEQMAALVVDIFAAIEAERLDPQSVGNWSRGYNNAIDAALAAAGDVVKRHGMSVERGKG